MRGYPRFLPHRNFPASDIEQAIIPSQRAQMPRPASTAYQPDIAQMAELRMHLRNREPGPLSAWARADDQRVAKCRFANFSQLVSVANQPIKMLVENPYRSLFLIANNTGANILFNFGRPPFTNAGIPLANGQHFQWGGLAISTDEIWVQSSVLGGIVTLFEGVPMQTTNIGHNGGPRMESWT